MASRLKARAKQRLWAIQEHHKRAAAASATALRGRGPELLSCTFQEFCESIRIKTSEGIKSFDLYDWQVDFANLVLENPRIPITLLSSRQTGKTADLLAILIYLALSIEQFSAVVVHRKNEDAQNLARRCKRLIPVTEKLESENLGRLEFSSTGSTLYFRSANHKQNDGAEGVGRGLESVDMIVIEEASHTLNVKEILGVIGATMTHSAIASIILVGTSGRKESYFYESLCDVYSDSNELEKQLEGIRNGTAEPYQVRQSPERISVITNWRAIPEFSAEGLDETGYPNYLKRIKIEQDLTDEQIASEHELIFDSDKSQAVFDWSLVQSAQAGEWEAPLPEGVYYAAVDGSGRPKNKHGDYTVLVVLRKLSDSYRVVKLYRKRNVTFEQRYAELSEILNDYRPIQTYVEANDGMGQTYEENLLAGCPSLDIQRFNQNFQRKANIIGNLVLGLEKSILSIPKSPIIQELLIFSELENGTMGAVGGKDSHDDCVMALAMALSASGFGRKKLSLFGV